MKPMIFVLLAMVLLSGCQSTTAVSSPDWRLVYAHDKDGNAVTGSKEQLLQYANEGRPVRVFWSIRDILSHVADAGFLTAMNGELFAQIDAISRQIPDRTTRKAIAIDASQQSRWHGIFATTGQLQSFQSANGELRTHQFPMKWYVYTTD